MHVKSDKIINFAIAINSMLVHHYRGIHTVTHCGHMRTARGVCDPFQRLDHVDALVGQHLTAAMVRVGTYVADPLHWYLPAVDLPVNDQAGLKRHFGLP